MKTIRRPSLSKAEVEERTLTYEESLTLAKTEHYRLEKFRG
jgi:hypothetical protein